MTAIKTYKHEGTGVIREYPDSLARLYPDLVEVQAAISGCRDCGPAVPVEIVEVVDESVDAADSTPVTPNSTPADVAPNPAAKAAKNKE